MKRYTVLKNHSDGYKTMKRYSLWGMITVIVNLKHDEDIRIRLAE